MSWLRGIREQPWRITIAAVGGLLVAILVAGVVGLLLNRNIEHVTEEALTYAVELGDEVDDLRVAIMDLRHYHRNLTFEGPSRGGIEDFEKAYGDLHDEIDELEEISVRDPEAPQPDEIRRIAEEYYADFRPAIDLYEEDLAAFTEASDRGLLRLDKMNQVAEELDPLGEQQAE